MKKKSFLAMLISAVLALITAVVIFGLSELAVHDVFGPFFHNFVYPACALIIATCIFFIVKQNYRSFWYVFLIANLQGIIWFFVHLHNSDLSTILFIFAVWGFLLIVTLIAALIGKSIESKMIKENSQLTSGQRSTHIAMFLSGVLAFFTGFVTSVFLINARHDYFGQFFSEDAGYITYDLIIAICIFFIVIKNYRSLWYVPIIANIIGMLMVFVLHYFDHPREFTYTFAGWGLSIIVTIIAALIGKRIESRKINKASISS